MIVLVFDVELSEMPTGSQISFYRLESGDSTRLLVRERKRVVLYLFQASTIYVPVLFFYLTAWSFRIPSCWESLRRLCNLK